MTTKKRKPGKSLEVVVAAIERALAGGPNIMVESPAHLPDRVTGGPREHDVVITVTGSHHKTIIAIECRDRSRKITVNDVEGFNAKCRDTKVDQGIIVSPKGFTKTALEKARHHNIRCLELSQVEAFNWLLAGGVKVRERRVLHTGITLMPEKNLDSPPTVFTVLLPSGDPIETKKLSAAAFTEFQKTPEEGLPLGKGEQKIILKTPGFSIRDDSNGVSHPIDHIVANVQYELVEEFLPFTLVTYKESQMGTEITNAAIAQLDVGNLRGKLMIVYKEDEGGQVVFVPENGGSA